PRYRDAFPSHAIYVVAPGPVDQQILDDVIWRDLVRGSFPVASRVQYNQVISRLKDQGCDCVILGCTEIPLLVRPDDCPLPTLDSTRLLARAAVEHALGTYKESVIASSAD